jgi:cell division protein FtsA
MPNEPNFITAIDVGSAKTSVLVAELSENGLRYRGHGISESRGLRKGVITELDKAVGSIQKAVEHAEDVAGIPIEHALIGIAGAHIRGMNSHGGIVFGARSREIARDEIRQAVDKARTVPLPADREILHLLPQEFILDDQPGVQDPTGMMCTRLEVRVHIVTASSSATQNLVTAVNRAGVHVDDTIFEPLACADSVLRSDERELDRFSAGCGCAYGGHSHRRRSLYQRSFGRHVHGAGGRGGAQEKFWQRGADAYPRRQRSRSAVGGRPAVAHDVTAVGR